jgi:hypothetical protein
MKSELRGEIVATFETISKITARQDSVGGGAIEE